MTDKVQLIKEEIERRMTYMWSFISHDENILPNNFTEEDIMNLGTYTTLESLLKFIDSLPEEPVSEDLKEYYTKEFLPKEWFAKPGHRTISQFNFFTAQHFAEWQKKKDQETIELAEDHAMLAGMNKMKEEMMKDAVEAEIFSEIKGSAESTESEFRVRSGRFKMDNIKLGDKVKIIIVKEEQ